MAQTNTKPRLVVVFYSLPIVQEQQNQIEMGYLEREFNNTLSAVTSLKQHNVISDFVWVGCTHNLDEREITKPLTQGSHAVNIPNQLFTDFTQGFVKGVIWPLFHSHIKDVKFEEKLWKSYQQANEAFALAVKEIYQPGDLVWVHGSALMLVPQLLRELLPNANIGFFLHAPFPSCDF